MANLENAFREFICDIINQELSDLDISNEVEDALDYDDIADSVCNEIDWETQINDAVDWEDRLNQHFDAFMLDDIVTAAVARVKQELTTPEFARALIKALLDDKK